MKNLLILLILLSTQLSRAQTDSTQATDEIVKFQKEFIDLYSNLKGSKQTKKLTSQDFFPINMKFRVVATLTKLSSPKILKMKTSSGALVDYKHYGILDFSIDGKPFQLPAYQSLSASDIAKHRDLFILFTDLTNGKTTYTAGRYIELPLPQQGGELVVDFNQAFNPYCAYSSKYSCPLVPAENHLDVEILAGIRFNSAIR